MKQRRRWLAIATALMVAYTIYRFLPRESDSDEFGEDFNEVLEHDAVHELISGELTGNDKVRGPWINTDPESEV